MRQPNTPIPDLPSPSEPVIRRPRWRRRLVISLPLVLALSGGLWWNATRLNATERKLVGVWESDAGGRAMVLLSDRRQFEFAKVLGREADGEVFDAWVYASTASRWRASPDSISLRAPISAPFNGSLLAWWASAKTLWNGDNRHAYQIARMADDKLSLHGDAEYHRSTNPEVLRLVEQLESGESQ